MERVFFKIVVPVYNSSFIENCILSIESQSFKDYIIVAVNDQCTDNTFDKVKKLAKTYNNIVCLEPTKKLYIGGARNYGIHYDIESEYTLFIDNDDWFDQSCILDKLAKHIEKTNYPDCVRLPYICLINNGRTSVKLTDDNPEKLVNSPYIAPWTKCIKSKLIVDFPENTMVEDVVQHIAQCDVIETVSPFEYPVIVWNRNNNKSASLKQNQRTLLNGKRFADIYRNVADLMELQCTHSYCEKHRKWRIKCYIDKIKEGIYDYE